MNYYQEPLHQIQHKNCNIIKLLFYVIITSYRRIIKKKDLFNSVVFKFIFINILLPEGPQKERMINFCIQNDNLNIFNFKPILEKFLINNEDIK